MGEMCLKNSPVRAIPLLGNVRWFPVAPRTEVRSLRERGVLTWWRTFCLPFLLQVPLLQPRELLMALPTCSSNSQVACGCPCLPHLSSLLGDPIPVPPAPCSPRLCGREGVTGGGGRGDAVAEPAPCSKPTPHLQAPCVCPVNTPDSPSSVRALDSLGVQGSVFLTRLVPCHLPRMPCQNSSFAASEMSFLYSCKLLSDLHAHVAGHTVLTAGWWRESLAVVCFRPANVDNTRPLINRFTGVC